MSLITRITKRLSGNSITPPQETKSFKERLGEILKADAEKFAELRSLFGQIEDAEVRARRIADRIIEARNIETAERAEARRTLDPEAFERAVAASMRRAAVDKITDPGWETSLVNGSAALQLAVKDPLAASNTVHWALQLVIQRTETEIARIEAEEIADERASPLLNSAQNTNCDEWRDYRDYLESTLKSAGQPSHGGSYFGLTANRPWIYLKPLVAEILASLPH